MASCVCCGIDIPNGQRTCSVCYGDPYHGSDGYLLRMMEKDAERQALEAALGPAVYEDADEDALPATSAGEES